MVICKIFDVTEYMFFCLYFILLCMKCKEILLPFANLSDYSMSCRRVFSHPHVVRRLLRSKFIKIHIYIRHDTLLLVKKIETMKFFVFSIVIISYSMFFLLYKCFLMIDRKLIWKDINESNF